MRLRLLVVAVVLLGLGVHAREARALGLTLGFGADPALTGDAPSASTTWIPRAVAEGASIVRVNLTWSEVAPIEPPSSFDPADPASPGYDWSAVDTSVRDLTSQGLQVLLNITGAPTWAEGPDPPPDTQPGTWRPDPTQFASFATAAARRYDGRFPDPLHPGAFLPRVRDWQPWNEPNLAYYLSPQWTRVGGRLGSREPGDLPSTAERVLPGGEACLTLELRRHGRNRTVWRSAWRPADAPGCVRSRPVLPARQRCLDAAQLPGPAASGCAVAPSLWDWRAALACPRSRTMSPCPTCTRSRASCTRPSARATCCPAGPKQLWVTEISWDSSPPDPNGVPILEQAHWLEQALYVLWRQGVDTVLWLQIEDSPPIPNYGSTYQAGLYYLNGGAKPATEAYRFPFVTSRLNSREIEAWGRSPADGKVAIEQLRGARWVPLRRLSVRVDQVFTTTVPVRGAAVLRAQVGGQTSLPWTQGG